MLTVLRFGAASGVLCGLFIAVPGAVEMFTGETIATSVVLGLSPALAPPPDTALTSGLRAGVGLTLVWLSLALRARLGTWQTSAPELVR
jgi:hypothetical protein